MARTRGTPKAGRPAKPRAPAAPRRPDQAPAQKSEVEVELARLQQRLAPEDSQESDTRSEQDLEEMASGSVQEQLLYQKGLAENHIDSAASALAKPGRARSRPADRSVESKPRAARGSRKAAAKKR